MTSRFYTPTGEPVVLSRGSSPKIRNEFQLMDNALVAVAVEFVVLLSIYSNAVIATETHTTQAGIATTQAGLAATSAASAVNAPSTIATSTSTMTISLGVISPSVQPGKAYAVGQFVSIASTVSPTNYMVGQITAYTIADGSMTVNSLQIGGAGTFSDWTIAIAAGAGVSLSNNTWTGTQTYQSIIIETPVVANTSTNYTVTNRSTHDLTLTGNWVPTFPALGAGKQFTLLLKQDATGSRTITWPAAVRWSAGVAPTITSVIGKTDVISFICDGTYWLGFVCAQNYTRA